MIVGRLLGWLLLFVGLVVLGRDLFGWLDTQHFHPIVLGELWFELDRGSLNLVQAAIQRHIWAPLWDPGMTTLLLWWAFPSFLTLGLLLVTLSARDERSTSRRRRR
jgi:hypothetical protein